MHKILFVCHGSICRSPMAKYVLQDMVDKRGISQDFYIDCAAMTPTASPFSTRRPVARLRP